MSGDFFIDPQLRDAHYSTRTFKGYFDYLVSKLGIQRAKELIEETGVTWLFFRDPTNWVSERFADRFYDILTREFVHEKEFCYYCGKLSFSKSGKDPIQYLAFKLGSPYLVFKQMANFARSYNRVDTIKVQRLTKNKLVLLFHSRRKTPHFDHIIKNWAGSLEAAVSLMDLPSTPCKIQKLSDQDATFELNWSNHSKYSYWRAARTSASIVLFGTVVSFCISLLKNTQFYLTFSHWIISILLSALLIAVTTLTLQRFRLDQFVETTESITQHLDEAAANYNDQVRKTHELSAKLGDLALQTAHDIRSPLAALKIIGSNLMHREEADTELFHQSLDRLSAIANKLINQAKSGEMNTATISSPISIIEIEYLIASIVREKKKEYENNEHIQLDFNIEVSEQYPRVVLFDRTNLKSILSNLINNAIEAMSKPGKILLQLTTEAKALEISVADTGIGISKEILKQLGQKGATFGKEKGLGLGLYQAKRSIENWKGSMQIESKTGSASGTTVTIRLPWVGH